MKRGTPSHPKMRRLATALEIPMAYAVGIVEGLFHFTAEMAPQGNVGKWGDYEIANSLGCTDIAGPALVAGLVAAGWLDEDPEHRLLVHDWSEHADKGVRMRLKNRGQCLLGAQSSEPGAQYSEPGAQSSEPGAQLTKRGAQYQSSSSSSSSEGESEGASIGSADRWAAQPIFARLKEVVPGNRRPAPDAIVERVALALRGGADGDHIVEAAETYYRSPHGLGRYGWALLAFIRDGHYDDPPAAWRDRSEKGTGAGATPKYDTTARDKRLAEDAKVIAEREQETTS